MATKPTRSAVIHVLPLGATHMDFLRSNDVVPIATYDVAPISATDPATDPAPHPQSIAEAKRAHPGHDISYIDPE